MCLCQRRGGRPQGSSTPWRAAVNCPASRRLHLLLQTVRLNRLISYLMNQWLQVWSSVMLMYVCVCGSTWTGEAPAAKRAKHQLPDDWQLRRAGLLESTDRHLCTNFICSLDTSVSRKWFVVWLVKTKTTHTLLLRTWPDGVCVCVSFSPAHLSFVLVNKNLKTKCGVNQKNTDLRSVFRHVLF